MSKIKIRLDFGDWRSSYDGHPTDRTTPYTTADLRAALAAEEAAALAKSSEVLNLDMWSDEYAPEWTTADEIQRRKYGGKESTVPELLGPKPSIFEGVEVPTDIGAELAAFGVGEWQITGWGYRRDMSAADWNAAEVSHIRGWEVWDTVAGRKATQGNADTIEEAKSAADAALLKLLRAKAKRCGALA